MFDILETCGQSAVIKVIGVGGGGGNAIEHMVSEDIEGVEFIVANTDAQALDASTAQTVLQLGSTITKGLGAGADPNVGHQSAHEDRERIAEVLSGADMVFITAGMGGGTGTGAAPVIAEIAQDMGILTVAVVTKPFVFEGRKRLQAALDGIDALTQHVDSLIVIPNEKLITELDRNLSLLAAFKAANQVLLGAVQGIAELITRRGFINVDFADVRAVMSQMGMAMMGSATASGENRARMAAEAAITSPFLEDINLAGARGILVNITAGIEMSVGEFEEVGSVIKEFASPDAEVVVGTVIDPESTGEMRVTVVATGLGRPAQAAQPAPAAPVEHERPVQVVRTGNGSVDYRELEKPTVMRSSRSGDESRTYRESDVEYYEIPTFLRKQANGGRRAVAECYDK